MTASKVKPNALGKFLKRIVADYGTSFTKLETKLGLSHGKLSAISLHGYCGLNDQFMKIPEILCLTREDTQEFKKLCHEYTQKGPASRPRCKYPLNPLGEFIRQMKFKYRLTDTQIERQLDLHANFMSFISRRKLHNLNDNFMRFPEIFHLSIGETLKFQELCEEYKNYDYEKGWSHTKRRPLSEVQSTNIRITEETAFLLSDSVFTQVIYA